ncbi:MAG: serine hydrolase domain-containing protein, partial [Hyphomonadaceae bacterium]
MSETLGVEGHVAPGFEPVRDLFASNFSRQDDYRELGAALCVYEGGRRIVDLWGGAADPARAAPWRADTLVNVWSTTKALTAFAVAVCADRGLFAYADPVASVWPEFAAAGKGAVTIAQVMSHQAGLPGFAEPTAIEDFEDWELVTARLAAQAPAFTPGAANSYHAATYGFLAGEIVRRATGKSLGRFVAEEIAGPLDADFFIGLPAALEHRVARLFAPKAAPDMTALEIPDAAMMALINPSIDPESPNARAWRAAEMPAL